VEEQGSEASGSDVQPDAADAHGQVIVIRGLVILGLALVLAASYWGYANHGPTLPPASQSYGVARTDRGLVVFNCDGGVGSARLKQGGLDDGDVAWEAAANDPDSARLKVPVERRVSGYTVSGAGLGPPDGSVYLSEMTSRLNKSVLQGVVEFDYSDLKVGDAATGVGVRTVAAVQAEYPSCLE